MQKNEPLLSAVSYFWHDIFNAFVFGHSLMTLTFLDVLMLTDLNITASLHLPDLNLIPSRRSETKNVGGWKNYIQKYKGKGPVSNREHTAFSMMWIDHYLFYGVSVGPTTNFQTIAERLAANNPLPLGKFLLGALYHTLHQSAVKIIKNEPIGNLGGPWWLLQMWVNLYAHNVASTPASNTLSFPTDYPQRICSSAGSVSYTHLTLPTKP